MSKRLRYGDGHRSRDATAPDIVACLIRRPSLLSEVERGIRAHPLHRCLDCDGETDGGRVVQIAHGGHRWLSCAACLRGEVVRQLPAAVVPGDA
ncbi:MAG TPA: hypothetical protein VMW48_13455 [Vicinamibacterales bacterium]|nr:hypothetical protein [Vicinamibacterales bacterium]